MTFDSKWDINKYHYAHEVPIYWEMKKKFMLNNMKKLPEERLVCLAQIFYNIKAMGCKYSAETMEEVSQLAEGIDDLKTSELRKRQIFVPASDAVHAKVTRQGLSSIPSVQEATKRQKSSGSGYISFVKSEDSYSSMQMRHDDNRREKEDNSPPSVSSDEPDIKKVNTTGNKNKWIVTEIQEEEVDDSEKYKEYKFKDDGDPPLALPRGWLQRKNEFAKKRKSDGTPSDVSPPKQMKRSFEDVQEPQLKKKAGLLATPSTSGSAWKSYETEATDYSTGSANDSQSHRQRNSYTSVRQSDNSGYKVNNKRLDAGAVMESGPFGRVVVFESVLPDDKQESPVSIIMRTAAAAHTEAQFSFSNGTNTNNKLVSCRLMLNGMFLASGEGATQKVAKEAACNTALQRLRETSFTIKVKAAFINESNRPVDRSLKRKSGDGWDEADAASVNIPLQEDNIGRKMMKLMGWSGGGLGKNQQGLQEPIRPDDTCINRSGLGIKNSQDFRRKVQDLLQEFSRSDSKDDLVFSPDFTKDERKLIHESVRKFNLKSRSFGKGEESRHIVVFRRVTPREIVEELISCGGETDKYLLIPPTAT